VYGDGGSDRGTRVAGGRRNEHLVEDVGLDDPADTDAVGGDPAAHTEASCAGEQPCASGEVEHDVLGGFLKGCGQVPVDLADRFVRMPGRVCRSPRLSTTSTTDSFQPEAAKAVNWWAR
jgi:hypothetical protein